MRVILYDCETKKVFAVGLGFKLEQHREPIYRTENGFKMGGQATNIVRINMLYLKKDVAEVLINQGMPKFGLAVYDMQWWYQDMGNALDDDNVEEFKKTFFQKQTEYVFDGGTIFNWAYEDEAETVVRWKGVLIKVGRITATMNEGATT